MLYSSQFLAIESRTRDQNQMIAKEQAPKDANRCHTILFSLDMIRNPDPIVRNRTNNSQRLRLTFSQLTNIRRIHNLTDAHAIATATDIST